MKNNNNNNNIIFRTKKLFYEDFYEFEKFINYVKQQHRYILYGCYITRENLYDMHEFCSRLSSTDFTVCIYTLDDPLYTIEGANKYWHYLLSNRKLHFGVYSFDIIAFDRKEDLVFFKLKWL